jgi:hypothetical protein
MFWEFDAKKQPAAAPVVKASASRVIVAAAAPPPAAPATAPKVSAAPKPKPAAPAPAPAVVKKASTPAAPLSDDFGGSAMSPEFSRYGLCVCATQLKVAEGFACSLLQLVR